MSVVVVGTLAGLGIGAARPAHADDGDGDGDGEAMLEAPAITASRPFADQIADRLTMLGEELDAHVGALSFDAVDIHVDGRARRARIRFAGRGGQLSLRLAGDVRFERGLARIQTRVDLGVAGHHLHLQLPEVEMVPRSLGGQRYVELRLPIFEGTF